MNNNEILTFKDIHSEYPDFSEQKLGFAAREGKLKAVKRGSKYYVTRSALNDYLGISNSDEELKKDLEIAKLKGQIKSLETQLQAFKSIAISLNNIVGL